jgi:hypothetical protein
MTPLRRRLGLEQSKKPDGGPSGCGVQSVAFLAIQARAMSRTWPTLSSSRAAKLCERFQAAFLKEFDVTASDFARRD